MIDRSSPPGLEVAVQVLAELGTDPARIDQWLRQTQERQLASRQAEIA